MATNAKLLGTGKLTLVLAHGYGGSQAVWDTILPHLTSKYSVLLFDWNFSGAVNDDTNLDAFDSNEYSSYYAFSDDLVALLDRMEAKKVVFVGHSMSGMIGCIASIKRPDLFSRLVLLGASPRYLNVEGYEGGFEQTLVDNIFSSIESNFEAWAEDFVKLVVGSDDPTSVQKFGNDFKRMRPKTALSLARTVFLSDYRDILGQVKVPCTIVQCSDDVAVPVSVGYYIQSKIEGKASIEIIEMKGHIPQLTAPDKLIDILDRVLANCTA